MSSTLEQTDGIMMITPASYEPEAVAAAKGWFAETGRPAYAVGPLLPSASKEAADANEKKQSTEGSQIQEFLDATLKASGPKSLLYVSARLTKPDARLIGHDDVYRSRSVRYSGLLTSPRTCGPFWTLSWSSAFPS